MLKIQELIESASGDVSINCCGKSLFYARYFLKLSAHFNHFHIKRQNNPGVPRIRLHHSFGRELFRICLYPHFLLSLSRIALPLHCTQNLGPTKKLGKRGHYAKASIFTKQKMCLSRCFKYLNIYLIKSKW